MVANVGLTVSTLKLLPLTLVSTLVAILLVVTVASSLFFILLLVLIHPLILLLLLLLTRVHLSSWVWITHIYITIRYPIRRLRVTHCITRWHHLIVLTRVLSSRWIHAITLIISLRTSHHTHVSISSTSSWVVLLPIRWIHPCATLSHISIVRKLLRMLELWMLKLGRCLSHKLEVLSWVSWILLVNIIALRLLLILLFLTIF